MGSIRKKEEDFLPFPKVKDTSRVKDDIVKYVK